MRLSKSKPWRTLSAALAFSTFLVELATAQPSPATDARTLAMQWLRGECGVGESAEAKLLQAGGALVPYFVEALENGPPTSDLEAIDAGSARRFATREQALKRGDGLGLNAEELEAARKVTREEYVARDRKNLDSRYRSQAISGLAIVGGPEAKAALQRAAKDRKSSLGELAAQTLARMAKTR